MDHLDSYHAAYKRHGHEVDKAVHAALERGVAKVFLGEPDPYAALMQWYRDVATERDEWLKSLIN